MSLVVVETEGPKGSPAAATWKSRHARRRHLRAVLRQCRDPAGKHPGLEEGQGFYQMMQQLPQERLIIACGAVGAMEGAVERTIAYCKEREAFGGPIMQFQNTRFKLAECKTKTTVARAFLDECMAEHLRGELTVEKPQWQILAHRHPRRSPGRLPATARRLRVHAGIRHRRDVDRRPGAAHLRWHQRNHEGTDCEVIVTLPQEISPTGFIWQDEAASAQRPSLRTKLRPAELHLHGSSLQPAARQLAHQR